MEAKLIGITDLRSNAKGIVAELTDRPVVVLSRSKPVAVLVHPDRWDALHDRLDELAAQLAMATRERDTMPLDVARKEVLGED